MIEQTHFNGDFTIINSWPVLGFEPTTFWLTSLYQGTNFITISYSSQYVIISLEMF